MSMTTRVASTQVRTWSAMFGISMCFCCQFDLKHVDAPAISGLQDSREVRRVSLVKLC